MQNQENEKQMGHSRVLKFRAWSNRDKCWCGAFAVHMSGLWRESPNNEWTDLSKQTEIVLIQYTGLLDKNGKEIYEGDVLKQFGCPILFQVEWYKTAFLAQGVNSSMRLWLHEPYGEIEVVGNIYENPELIK